MTDAAQVTTDLAADGESIDALVRDLEPGAWATPTPAPGWTVAHQIAHLAATFRMATMAAADPDSFMALTAGLGPNFTENVTRALGQYLNDPPGVLLTRWREERAAAVKALAALPYGQLVPWLVRPIPAGMLACAGMMEMFGHGQDIADALGVRRTHTDRLRHLVTFAVRTWDFGYLARGLDVPGVAFRFEITAPSGERWEFGPADSQERVTGPAEDFCLLVTRRRHPDDLAVRAEGQVAPGWLSIAQAYRGPAGEGRRPGQFDRSAGVR
ncbi:wyosine base formation [Actinoplanes cyaneus]|uniref:Wyosine base formation n=1 Tax=Actinoplanes cyaneus TaxID=52696 RepID=A0A919ISJ0_9ACTN|nr:TIGR03084 family metal-binding protein [Actinoplanes cyaneus]MCW2138177.1 TIGR03084 family protein [Actinoplanes cyaneus]GID70527.1 wyosine base formation [Actinoplanes cyaneus]